MLTFRNVSKSFDGQRVLDGVSFSVGAPERVALVGVNGAGKSTILELAAGLLVPDAGVVELMAGTSVAYVPQDFGVVAGQRVGDYMKERAGVLHLERSIRSLERALEGREAGAGGAGPSEQDLQRYADLLQEFTSLGGYEFEQHAAQALTRAGLPEDAAERRLGELSGGQRVRAGLAAILASSFDLYLLDEPTNNLDLGGIALLEEFVSTTARSAFLVVSHDRRFLRTVATAIVEVDDHTHTATPYGVSFDEYLKIRSDVLGAQVQRYRDYATEVARLRSTIRELKGRGSDAYRGRPSRDNDKLSANLRSEHASQSSAAAAKALEKRLSHMSRVEKPWEPWELRLQLESHTRSGDVVVRLTDCEKRYPGFRLGPLSTALYWQDRVALVGPNGSGKSTLVRLVTGELFPDSGDVRRGHNVVVGLLDQHYESLDRASSVLANFTMLAPMPETDARTLLAKFDLGADDVGRTVATLSPGERSRLLLAVLMARGANVLVLDEPTNDLDIEAQEQLELALSGFAGTLLVVSHDREFMGNVGITRVLEMEDGRLAERTGPAGLPAAGAGPRP
jgi:ATPase subunit of ABC transporter with duplicated ATPase domains